MAVAVANAGDLLLLLRHPPAPATTALASHSSLLTQTTAKKTGFTHILPGMSLSEALYVPEKLPELLLRREKTAISFIQDMAPIATDLDSNKASTSVLDSLFSISHQHVPRNSKIEVSSSSDRASAASHLQVLCLIQEQEHSIEPIEIQALDKESEELTSSSNIALTQSLDLLRRAYNSCSPSYALQALQTVDLPAAISRPDLITSLAVSEMNTYLAIGSTQIGVDEVVVSYMEYSAIDKSFQCTEIEHIRLPDQVNTLYYIIP
jgi:hypothetical protein